MKKIMSLMLGLSMLTGVAVFADNPTSTTKSTKTKSTKTKGKKKSTTVTTTPSH